MIVEDQVMIRGLLETYFTKENGDQIVASIPGACIIVGPFIYVNKLCQTMNEICINYNTNGY